VRIEIGNQRKKKKRAWE